MAHSGVVDTHLHVWDLKRFHYPWLDSFEPLRRSFLLGDYVEAIRGIDIVQMVFVQCETEYAQGFSEAQWVADLAEQDKRIVGIVAQAPLEQGDAARPALDALKKIPIMRGVRRLIQGEPKDFAVQPGFVRGVQRLADYGMSFDICIKHDQMPETIRLVRQCPKVQFMLDHIGKPDIKGKVFEPWRSHIRELAALPNVYCKISGFINEADPRTWTKEQFKSYFDPVLDAFGWSRIAFGGDWPVCAAACTYRQWFEALEWIVKDATPAQRKALFAGNARKFYRLTEPEHARA